MDANAMAMAILTHPYQVLLMGLVVYRAIRSIAQGLAESRPAVGRRRPGFLVTARR